MQIKQQQSTVRLLICARSWVKFPSVLRDVHCAIRGRSESGRLRRGEESAALKDGGCCHLFTVKLILSPPLSLPLWQSGCSVSRVVSSPRMRKRTANDRSSPQLAVHRRPQFRSALTSLGKFVTFGRSWFPKGVQKSTSDTRGGSGPI